MSERIAVPVDGLGTLWVDVPSTGKWREATEEHLLAAGYVPASELAAWVNLAEAAVGSLAPGYVGNNVLKKRLRELQDAEDARYAPRK